MNVRLLSLAAAATLLVGACGGDDGDAETGSSSPATSEAATAAASATSAATSASTAASSTASTTAATAATGATTTSSAAASASDTAVELKEWSVTAPASLKAGTQNFAITNAGENPHELVVMQGSYESLPKSDIGAVVETQLPAGAVIDRTDRIEPGSSAELSVDLAAGQFVLLCNISVGPNSHAGKGQYLDVSVG